MRATFARFSGLKGTDVAYAYLEDDITLDDNLTIQGDKDAGAKTLYLCLNGHTLNLGEYMIWVGNRGGTLYLCDCSTDQTGTVSGGSNRCVSVSDAFNYASTFNMYGGTLTGGTASTGGGVDVSNGIMNMYGGTIEENTATSDGGIGQHSVYGCSRQGILCRRGTVGGE